MTPVSGDTTVKATESQHSFTHRPTYTPQTSKLIEYLASGKPGDECTDEELGDLIMMELNTKPGNAAYRYLRSAINYLLANHGILWERVRGQHCIRCSDDKEKVAKAVSELSGIRRKAKRASRVTLSTNTLNLTAEERQRHAAMTYTATFIYDAASNKAQERLIETGVPRYDQTKMLELFPGAGSR